MLAGQGVGLKGARRRLLRVEAGGGAVGVTAGTGALASGLRSVGEHRMGDGGGGQRLLFGRLDESKTAADLVGGYVHLGEVLTAKCDGGGTAMFDSTARCTRLHAMRKIREITGPRSGWPMSLSRHSA